MRRIEVSRRTGSAEEVRGSLAAHRGLIGGNLDDKHPASPETGFSYQAMFDHMDGELAKIHAALVEAEDRHVRQLARISQLRRRRDRGVTETYDKQKAARGILAHLYGKERDFELAAVSGKTPASSKMLAEQVDQTVKFLREPEGDEPKRKVAGVKVDFETMADDLEGGHTQLIEVRVELLRANKVADGTRRVTAQAIREFDLVFLWIARSLEGVFRLAGEEELANRIRTSARRVTRRQAEQEEEEAASPEPSSDGPVAEAADSAPSEAGDSAPSEAPDSAPSEATEQASQPASS